MRLWSIHPKYLDGKGLVALWREGLLAQAVLSGKTKGYTDHPQLIRFKCQPYPADSIALYLVYVYEESAARDFCFDRSKIGEIIHTDISIDVTQGQIDFELAHLMRKLMLRSPALVPALKTIKTIEPHPLFKIIPGGIADWEKAST
jgi:hypothetical protein